MPDVDVRVAGAGAVGALASLRALWHPGDDADLEHRMAAWLAADGERRTTWLATLAGAPVGMASLFEYRRMPRADRPDSRWGYVGNVFVRADLRGRGIGSALLTALVTAADERGYARLVLSPSPEAPAFFRRAGFVVAGGAAGDDLLLVRRGSSGAVRPGT
jgi:GNAT superfamily N-acetyltransferase